MRIVSIFIEIFDMCSSFIERIDTQSAESTELETRTKANLEGNALSFPHVGFGNISLRSCLAKIDLLSIGSAALSLRRSKSFAGTCLSAQLRRFWSERLVFRAVRGRTCATPLTKSPL